MIISLFIFFFTITAFIFLIGEFAAQEAALKVEKSCVPSKIFAPFIKRSMLSFFFYMPSFIIIKRK